VIILKKRILQITLIISMLCFTVLPSFAESLDNAKDTIIQPRWTEISQFNNSFNITSSGRADIKSSMSAFNVDLIRVEANLQQFKNGSWVTIKTWTGTSQDVICSVVGSWYVQRGYSYRMVSTGTVYINGQQVEQANYTSNIRYY
jgi:hypothetical protein